MSPDVNDPGRSARKLVRDGAGEVGRPVGAPPGPRWTPTFAQVRRAFSHFVPALPIVTRWEGRGHRIHRAHSVSAGVSTSTTAMTRRRSWHGARCLVTGASSGLGRALAERLVRAGASVALTGRSVERLQGVAQGLINSGFDPAAIIPIPADLTVYEDRERLFAKLADHFNALDLVVNSAGVGAAGLFETHDHDVLRKVFEINVFALAEVCRAALPLLSRGQRPVLVNMGSIVARRGLPGRAEYSASKFAVTGFSEALRVEWRRLGIHVLQVNPGFTDTPFDQHAVVNTARYSVSHLRMMSADAVAAAILRASQRRRRSIALSWRGNLLLTANAIAPQFVDWGFSRWLLRFHPSAPLLPTGAPAETSWRS